MKRGCGQTFLLLWSSAVIALNSMETMANVKDPTDTTVDLSNKSLLVIPNNGNNLFVSNLEIDQNLITLNGTDRLALATYHTLTELYLDENMVTAVPAEYFSVLPNLTNLSLSRNKISSLDPEALSGLGNLEELDLSHNLLTSLPTNLTRGINTLKVLRLYRNAWNCSCPLLLGIYEVIVANISIGKEEVTCVSPANQARKDLLNAVAACYRLPSTAFTTKSQTTPVTTENTHQPWTTSVLKTTQSSTKNQSLITDKTPVLGNSWKFTASVLALALTTTMLIVCAIKGPSLYKVYHDYRHRRLGEDIDDEDDIVAPTNFAQFQLNHNTFTFTQDSWQVDGEEEEEVYFEDPYIRRDEKIAGGADMVEP